VIDDPAMPPTAGIEIADATIDVTNVYVRGAVVGIDIRGRSEPLIADSRIMNNLGAGVDIADVSRPKLERNLIAANGDGKPGPVKPGVEVAATARPVLKDNAIVDNGHELHPVDYMENFFGGIPASEAIRLIDEPEAVREPKAAPGPGALPGGRR